MGGAAALQLVRDTGLTGLVRSSSEHVWSEFGSQRLLPVLPELRGLLPGGGLRRGSTVAVATGVPAVGGPATAGTSTGGVSAPGVSVPGVSVPGVSVPGVSVPGVSVPGVSVPGAVPPADAPVAATSLLLALLAEASRAGSWCGIVGMPALGVVAAAELGVALDRLALIPNPGPQWPTVVAALLDGLDIVVTAVPGSISAVVAGRLAARARQRGSVLMPYGPWPGAALTLEAIDARWHGLEQGRGRLRARQLTVLARGRGAAGVPRHTHLWLPRPAGLFDAPQVATIHPLPQLSTVAEAG
jgi:hypothetical protein